MAHTSACPTLQIRNKKKETCRRHAACKLYHTGHVPQCWQIPEGAHRDTRQLVVVKIKYPADPWHKKSPEGTRNQMPPISNWKYKRGIMSASQWGACTAKPAVARKIKAKTILQRPTRWHIFASQIELAWAWGTYSKAGRFTKIPTSTLIRWLYFKWISLWLHKSMSN